MSRELPKGWEQTTIDNVFIITLGQSPPSSTYNTVGNGLPFFQGKAEFGEIYPVAKKWCDKPKKVAEKEDVLISVRAPVGPTNLAPNNCCIGRGLAAIHPISGINSRFVLYQLRSFEDQIADKGAGTTFKAITGSQLKNLPIYLPPRSEQLRIVSKIEELFTKLDAGVDALHQVQVQLKSYRQSVLKAAVEGRLTEEWRGQNKDKLEPGDKLLERILKERREKWEAEQLATNKAKGKEPPKNWQSKYNEPEPPNTTDLPELPEGWMWVSVRQIGEVITGTTPSKSKPEYFGGNYPFYKPTDLNEGYYTKNSSDSLTIKGIKKARLLPEKAILVTCIGATIGKTGLIRKPGAFNQQINAIIPANGINAEYTYFICISPFFQKQILKRASATTLPILNKSKFEELIFALPSPQEQKEIAYEVERLFSIIEKTETLIESELKRSQSLRQSILKRAFEGKLVPQDPSDEPASVLLERIKGEKAKAKKS